jgi:hypothetical protein
VAHSTVTALSPAEILQQQNLSLTEFRSLIHHRDCIAYQVVGGAQVTLSYLNLGEVEMARTALLNSLARYQDADRAIDNFRKEHYSNGNRTTAA